MNAHYESRKLLSEYLLFHFGCEEDVLPAGRNWPQGMRDALFFPARTASFFGRNQVEKGLDLGCAVGGSSFEMGGSCSEVIGVDFSKAFIDAASALAKGESVSFERLDEGRLTTPLAARVGPARGLVVFEQGDAMNLRLDLSGFDRVHAANLICRLPQPMRLLERFPDLVKPGGELVLATPCTWLEEFTPQGNWPQGSTDEWLEQVLSADFELVKRAEEPFLIRETARKFQWSLSLVTAWRRRHG